MMSAPHTTELKHWRLNIDNGRQVWTYEPGHKQSFIEKYHLGLTTVCMSLFPPLPLIWGTTRAARAVHVHTGAQGSL